MKQLPLFNRWQDGRVSLPDEGQRILEYVLIEDPDNEMDCFKKYYFEFDGRTLCGPIVNRYCSDPRQAKPVGYWQPIDELINE